MATEGVFHQSWARRENWALVGCGDVRDEEAWFARVEGDGGVEGRGGAAASSGAAVASRDAAVASMGAASFGAAASNGCGGGARGVVVE